MALNRYDIMIRSEEFENLNDFQKIEILNQLIERYGDKYEIALNEFHAKDQISQENEIIEWYKGYLNDSEFELLFIVKSLESSMRSGISIMLKEFSWL